MNIYDFSVKTRLGKEISLKDYEGKVLLIVNTATGCGFTPQYTGLQELYNKYKDNGFEILDFPCNQFANQAPGTDDEIHTFWLFCVNCGCPAPWEPRKILPFRITAGKAFPVEAQ